MAEKYCSVLAISFTNIKYYYDEKGEHKIAYYTDDEILVQITKGGK